MTPPLSIWFIDAGINNNATTCNEDPTLSKNAGKLINIVGIKIFLLVFLAPSIIVENFFLLHADVKYVAPYINKFNHSPINVRILWTIPCLKSSLFWNLNDKVFIVPLKSIPIVANIIIGENCEGFFVYVLANSDSKLYAETLIIADIFY